MMQIRYNTLRVCAMAKMKGKRVMTSVYLDPSQHAALERLKQDSRVPTAERIREAIDDLLAKYSASKRRARR